jgi:hypothetical protein
MLVGKMTLSGDIAMAIEGKVHYRGGRTIERFFPTAVAIVPDGVGQTWTEYPKKDTRGNLL